MINKISDIKNKDKKKYNIQYYNKNKNKINTEEITRSLKKLHNKLINFSVFNEEYNKFMDNIVKFEYYKSEKEPGSVSINQKKMKRYVESLKDVADFYNSQVMFRVKMVKD